jgi:molybdenum cofactor cytidylyltransferase
MEPRHDVAAVVLAAGESRRFGSPKQVATWQGRSLLEHVLERARLAGLRPIVAVVPIWLTRPASLPDGEALRWVRNAHPERGMSHSLRMGFAALPDTVGAAVILLGDQPTVTVQHLLDLQSARGTHPYVATLTEGVFTAPVLVERGAFDAVAGPSGDIGLREVLRANAESVTAVEPDAPFPDIDAPDDLERISDT